MATETLVRSSCSEKPRQCRGSAKHPLSQSAIGVTGIFIPRLLRDTVNFLNSKKKRVSCVNGVLHDESGNNTLQSKQTRKSKNMKTKVTHLAAILFAAVSFAPAAFANPKYTPHFSNGTNTKPAASNCCMTNDVCKSKPCCNTKTVSTTSSGRASQNYTKKVVSCDTGCSVAAGSQRAICKKGLRA